MMSKALKVFDSARTDNAATEKDSNVPVIQKATHTMALHEPAPGLVAERAIGPSVGCVNPVGSSGNRWYDNCAGFH
jgi:hypothetical protein